MYCLAMHCVGLYILPYYILHDPICTATMAAICSITTSAINQTSMWFQVMAATIRVRYESGEFADHRFKNLPPIEMIGASAHAATV